jgi:hypothetical protein
MKWFVEDLASSPNWWYRVWNSSRHYLGHNSRTGLIHRCPKGEYIAVLNQYQPIGAERGDYWPRTRTCYHFNTCTFFPPTLRRRAPASTIFYTRVCVLPHTEWRAHTHRRGCFYFASISLMTCACARVEAVARAAIYCFVFIMERCNKLVAAK